MELKSLYYIIFIAVFIAVYFALSKIRNAQKYALLAANLILIYLASGIRSIVVIFVLCTESYIAGRAIDNSIESGKKRFASIYMWLSVTFSIAVLSYFKFFSDLRTVLFEIASSKGINISSLIMPIGISYYTLTMIAYIVDVYHKKYKAEKDFVLYLTFITYFPTIVEGPINLYKKVAYQFKTSHEFDIDRGMMGFQRLLWGYIKKVVIADRIGILVTNIIQDNEAAGFTVFWAMVLYSFQIYTDFSGGIDVIMGVSEILDIKLTENFRSPLVSKSVTEYWQRWHISLGEFMEKYIYYPIVLNRNVMKLSKKIPSKYLQKVFSATLASIIVFIIVGIWHGTGWNYVVYGCYQAFFVSSAVLLNPVYKKITSALHLSNESISWNFFKTIRTFVILSFGRCFIRAGNLGQAADLFRRIFVGFKWQGIHILFDNSLTDYGLDYKNIDLILISVLLIILVDILHEHKVHIRSLILKQDIVFRYAVYLGAIFVIIIFGIYGPEFDSSSFIYEAF